MELAEAIRTLREHEADLKKMGVKSLYVFGSTARGEQDEQSDVDLFFDFEPGTLGLFQLLQIKEQASEYLGCPADVMTRSSLSKYIRAQVEIEAVPVFIQHACEAELARTDQPLSPSA